VWTRSARKEKREGKKGQKEKRDKKEKRDRHLFGKEKRDRHLFGTERKKGVGTLFTETVANTFPGVVNDERRQTF
jgi:hypothetical protein